MKRLSTIQQHNNNSSNNNATTDGQSFNLIKSTVAHFKIWMFIENGKTGAFYMYNFYIHSFEEV
jgi:hypothetical protein